MKPLEPNFPNHVGVMRMHRSSRNQHIHMGGTIYSVKPEFDTTSWDSQEYYIQLETEWNDIGEIKDVILDKDGKMIGIVAEIGGFLDVGDKHVMLPTNDIKLVAVDDKSYAYVTRYSEEQLEKLEGVDEAWYN